MCVGNFHPAGAKLLGQCQHVGHALGILPVHHKIERKGHALSHDQPCGFEFFGMGACHIGNPVGRVGQGILKGELDMIQPGFGQRVQ